MKTQIVRPILIDIKEVRQDFPADEYRDYLNLHIPMNPEFKPLLALMRQTHFINKQNPVELILINIHDKISLNDYYYFDGMINKADTELSLAVAIKIKADKVIARQSQLSSKYIQQSIEAFNHSFMRDVEIEMEYVLGDIEDESQNLIPILQPKLTDGFITIVKPLEKEYPSDVILHTDKEVLNLLNKFNLLMSADQQYTRKDLKDWFIQNKKK